MKRILTAFFVCWMPFSITLAETSGFFSAGAGLMTWENKGVSSIDPENVFFRGGVSLNPTIDLGFEWSTTLLDEKFRGIDWEMETTLIFMKVNLPLNEKTKLYLIGGATSVDLTSRQSGLGSSTFKDNDTGYGVGLQFGSSDSATFIIEHMTYYDDANEFNSILGNIVVESFNIGFNAYF